MMDIALYYSGWSNAIHGVRIPIACPSLIAKRRVDYMQVSSDGLISNIGKSFAVAVS